MAVKRKNEIAIINRTSGFRVHLKRLNQLVHVVLGKLGYRGVCLSLVFVSDARIRHLNQRYLNHRWATDVLAFPYSNFPLLSKGLNNCPFLGEVIISPRRAQVYSRQLGISFAEELMRYVCHGILHLKGYSDDTLRAQALMRREERKLLKALGPKIKGII